MCDYAATALYTVVIIMIIIHHHHHRHRHTQSFRSIRFNFTYKHTRAHKFVHITIHTHAHTNTCTPRGQQAHKKFSTHSRTTHTDIHNDTRKQARTHAQPYKLMYTVCVRVAAIRAPLNHKHDTWALSSQLVFRVESLFFALSLARSTSIEFALLFALHSLSLSLSHSICLFIHVYVW